MTDYRRPLEFGVSLAPSASELELIFTAAAAADGRLDLVGVQDHPYQRRFVDTMSLLAAITQHTETLRVFPDVACLPLRPPAVLANEAASIDIMSDGRFELGLGAGAFWDDHRGNGWPTPVPRRGAGCLGGSRRGHPSHVEWGPGSPV